MLKKVNELRRSMHEWIHKYIDKYEPKSKNLIEQKKKNRNIEQFNNWTRQVDKWWIV